MACTWERYFQLIILRGLLAVALLAFAAAAVAQTAGTVSVVPQTAHSNAYVFTISDDGKLILSVGDDDQLKLWDVKSGKLIRNINPDQKGIGSVAIWRSREGAEDGDRLLLLSAGKSNAKLWDGFTGSLIRSFDLDRTDMVKVRVGFSAGAEHIICFDGFETLWSWDRQSGRELLRKRIGGYNPYAVFSSDGSRMFTSERDIDHLRNPEFLKLWDTATGESIRQLTGNLSQPNHGLALSRDGKRALVVYFDGIVEVWDTTSGTCLYILTMPKEDYSATAVISPDGTRAITGGVPVRRLWDLDSGKEIRRIAPDLRGLHDFQFVSDGDRTIGADIDIQGFVLWDLKADKPLQTYSKRADTIGAVAYFPEGDNFLSANESIPTNSTGFRVWDGRKAGLIKSIQTQGYENIIGIVDLPGKNLGIITNQMRIEGEGQQAKRVGDTLNIRDAANGKPLGRIEFPLGKMSGIEDREAVSPDGKLLAVSGQDINNGVFLEVWNIRTGKLQHAFDKKYMLAGQGHFATLAFSTDGKQLVTERSSGPIETWGIADGQPVSLVRLQREPWLEEKHDNDPWAPSNWGGTDECSRRSAGFSPDRSQLFCLADGVVSLWNSHNGKRLWRSGVDLCDGTYWKQNAESSRDGKYILLSCGGHLHILRTTDGAPVKTLHTRDGASIASADISPDGSHVVAAVRDGSIRMWDFAKGNELVQIVATKAETGSDEWVSITPAGYYAGTTKADDLIAVVCKAQAYAVSQFFKYLYRPDLVVEALTGDPDNKYATASASLNLEQIIDTNRKQAPQLVLDGVMQQKNNSEVRISVSLWDQGGGIGNQLEWTLNGLALPNTTVQRNESGPISRAIVPMIPGKAGVVEVVGYNKNGYQASSPLLIPLDAHGKEMKGRLYVLAVGPDYKGSDFQLSFSANDAADFAKATETDGKPYFGSENVVVVSLVGPEATARGIEVTFDRMIRDMNMQPEDTFVLFMSGHGKYIVKDKGPYFYFLPQNLASISGDRIADDPVSHNRLVDWLKQIKAMNRIIILDTCDSGPGVRAISYSLGSQQKVDWQRLQKELGNNFGMLAAATMEAKEHAKFGHGLLTYTLLEQLGTMNPKQRDKEVTFGQLVQAAIRNVPFLSEEITSEKQTPYGNMAASSNIPLGYRVAAFKPPVLPPPIQRHWVIACDVRVLTHPNSAADETERQPAGSKIVDIHEYSKNEWAHISWGNGADDGWIPKVYVRAPGAGQTCDADSEQ